MGEIYWWQDKMNSQEQVNINKAMTVEERRKLLKRELRKYGLKQRHDSRLAQSFLGGYCGHTVKHVAAILL